MYGEFLRYSFDLNRWLCFLLPCPVFLSSARPGTATMKPSAPEPRRTTPSSHNRIIHGSPEAPGERGAPPRAGEAAPSSPLAPAGRTSTRASTRTTPAEGGCGRCCGRKGEGATYALLTVDGCGGAHGVSTRPRLFAIPPYLQKLTASN